MTNLYDNSSRWDCISIFSFKRLRLEREQIRQILLDLEQLTSDTSFTLEKLFLKRAEQDFRVERRPYSDKIAMSLRAASQILNKTKNLLGKSKVFLSWECKQQIFVGGAVRKEIFFFFFFFFFIKFIKSKNKNKK